MEKKKIHTGRALVVEGKYDLQKLRSVTDDVIIKTDGFGVFKNPGKRDLIRRYALSSGVIILTDSDSAGRLIRKNIRGFVRCPEENLTDVYIPKVPGKEKRKKQPSREGLIGVEGFSAKDLETLLSPFEDGAQVRGEKLTRSVLYADGFFGGDSSAVKRKKLLSLLGLPEDLSVGEIIGASGVLFTVGDYRKAAGAAQSDADAERITDIKITNTTDPMKAGDTAGSEKGENMIKTGLTSVSFRKLSVDSVIETAVKAGVDGIEWGGDVHVPAGNVDAAKYAAEATVKNGLEVISYGSYFSLGTGADIFPVLDTAKALGTRNIRIWAGGSERQAISDERYAELVEEGRRIGEAAAVRQMTVSFEYHPGSLTATAESAIALVNDIGCENIRLYWQQILKDSPESNLADLKKVMPYLTNVHVFNYVNGKQALLEEGDGVSSWKAYIAELKKSGAARAVMTEFAKDGLPENFIRDAAVLKELLK